MANDFPLFKVHFYNLQKTELEKLKDVLLHNFNVKSTFTEGNFVKLYLFPYYEGLITDDELSLSKISQIISYLDKNNIVYRKFLLIDESNEAMLHPDKMYFEIYLTIENKDEYRLTLEDKVLRRYACPNCGHIYNKLQITKEQDNAITYKLGQTEKLYNALKLIDELNSCQKFTIYVELVDEMTESYRISTRILPKLER